MNIVARRFAVSACAFLLAAVPAALAGPVDYQATGPVLAVTDSTVTILKGKENWEIGKDATTKGAEGIKVGDKITVHYTMTAISVESKGTAAAKPAAAAGKTKGAKKDAAPAAAPSAAPAASPKA